MTFTAQPGTPAFENAIFILNQPITHYNATKFSFKEEAILEPIDDTAWALPIYLSADFNLFLIFAPNYGRRWTASCAQVTIENGNQITQMSNLVPTGTGFTALTQLNQDTAVAYLAYFESLAAQHLGYWATGPTEK